MPRIPECTAHRTASLHYSCKKFFHYSLLPQPHSSSNTDFTVWYHICASCCTAKNWPSTYMHTQVFQLYIIRANPHFPCGICYGKESHLAYIYWLVNVKKGATTALAQYRMWDVRYVRGTYVHVLVQYLLDFATNLPQLNYSGAVHSLCTHPYVKAALSPTLNPHRYQI